jgi:hypothetical protein
MTDKSEWQKANRELIAEERGRLGDPPTAEEMLAFSRGELTDSEEERIRDLLVAYPELARMYREPFPDAPRLGDEDHVSEAQVGAGWRALQQRLPSGPIAVASTRDEAQRGHVRFQYVPTAIAAALAIVFFGLFVQAERRARYHAQQGMAPRMLAAPQELDPDGNRGPGAATMLRKDGEAYLLKPRLINQVRYAHYQVELRDASGAVLWSNKNAQRDEDDAFQLVVPHAFLREGETYRLGIFGVDGETREQVGSYDLRVPAE